MVLEIAAGESVISLVNHEPHTGQLKMRFDCSTVLQWLFAGSLMIGLPLGGVLLCGLEVKTYLEFPPLARHVSHAPFSWWVFALFIAINLAAVVFIASLLGRARRRSHHKHKKSRAFPPWGWLGVVTMLGGWCLAWTRFEWFSPFQQHTFCLPWAGYIVLVNALCSWRSDRSLIGDAPGRFALLILASALFWWFFEYLNRFVQNWYYTGIEDFGPLAYTAFASLAFATVLPAVLSTYRLLLTFPLLSQGPADRYRLPVARPRLLATCTLTAAALGLTLLGILPDILFALLWVSPLLVITSLQALSGRKTIFTPLIRGDWRALITASMAALICGFFWEMWNIGSLAQWHYCVPYVDRFHIFAMPALGYGGYLPFGLECLVVGKMVMGEEPLRPDEISRQPL